MCAREVQFRLTAHKNHGAEDFRGGQVMRGPRVPVYPSLAQEESPSSQPGFCGHMEDTWPGAPGSRNYVMCPTSLELINMSQRSLRPAWPCLRPRELKYSVDKSSGNSREEGV